MTIVILYMLTLFVMAILSAQRVHSMEDYAVAGRGYPAWVIFATLCATFVGGGFTMGNAEQVHIYGLVFMIAIAGISAREFLVSFFIAPHMNRFNQAISVGDIMKEAFGMPAKILTGLFAGILCAGLIGIQLRAMGYVFETFFGLELTYGILLGCAMVIFYVTLGGFKAVVWTDILQFGILVIALPLTAFLAVHAVGGPSAMIAALPPDRLELFIHFSPLGYLSIVSYFLIGEALSPPYIQRLLVGDSKQVKRATLWTAFAVLFLGFVVGVMALATLALSPTSQPHEVVPYLVKTVLPVGIAGFVMAAMLAVIMSSADSFLNAAAVNLIHDVTKPLFAKKLNNRQEMWMTQGITLILGVVAVSFAISFQNLFDAILAVFSLWSPIVLVPMVAAIRGYQGKSWEFLVVSGTGLLGSLGWDYYLGKDTDINGLFVGTGSALIAFLLIRAIRMNYP